MPYLKVHSAVFPWDLLDNTSLENSHLTLCHQRILILESQLTLHLLDHLLLNKLSWM